MSNNLEFIATIQSGHIIPPAGMGTYFRAHHNKQVKVIVSQNIKKRSLQANSFYWGVIIPEVRQFRMDNGDTVSNEQVHEDLIQEFAPYIFYRTLDLTGKWRQKRTKEMNKKEFSDYVTAIIARLSEFGCHIPMEGEA